jgi:hypothetical protein
LTSGTAMVVQLVDSGKSAGTCAFNNVVNVQVCNHALPRPLETRNRFGRSLCSLSPCKPLGCA